MSEGKEIAGKGIPKVDEDDRLTLSTLFEEEYLDQMIRKIATATDMAVALANYRGDECTHHINFCEFCRVARQGDDPVCKVSNATNAFGITQAAVIKKPFIYFCPYDLLMVAIPIIVDEEYLGGFIGGQVRCEDAPKGIVKLKNVMPCKENYLEDEELRAIYETTPLLPYQKVVDTADLIETFLFYTTRKRKSEKMESRIRSLESELEAEKIQREKAEKRSQKYKLLAQRTQSRPYFFMSTLTAISNLAIIENAITTNEMITHFARFISDLFRRQTETVTIAQEMEMIRSYLEIYKFWMRDRLSYTIRMEKDSDRQILPSMLIFPYVEQAAYHAAVNPNREGIIRVSARCEGEEVLIRICDNRPVIEENDNSSMMLGQIEEMQGFPLQRGLDMARERMEDCFHGNYELTIRRNSSDETVCTIRWHKLYESDYI